MAGGTRVGTVSLADLHGRIVRDTFGPDLGDADALLVFSILHCYRIELSGPVLFDLPAVVTVSPVTQRSCGEAMADIWSGPDEPRAQEMFWYNRWQEWGSYSRFERLTAEERSCVRCLIGQLERHPFVSRLTPEDFDLTADPRNRAL